MFASWRRTRLSREPLPDAWRAILVARKLPVDDEKFVGHLMAFALEKEWIGVDGLVVTDEMKVLVSAAAARLARNLDLDVYEGLGTIILHPGSIEKTEDGHVLGQAHRLGAVSLSWDAVKQGIANKSDGHDTTLHELAHVLDVSDGEFDGTPELATMGDRKGWARAFAAAFVRLRAAQLQPGAKGVMREYGATNEAEFFAVATEVFFEKPHHLKKREPALYDALVHFYGVDPATRG